MWWWVGGKKKHVTWKWSVYYCLGFILELSYISLFMNKFKIIIIFVQIVLTTYSLVIKNFCVIQCFFKELGEFG